MSDRQLKKLYFLSETYKEDNKILREIVDSLCKLSVITLLVEVLLEKLDLDISGIDWRLSNRDGGGPAKPEAGWCWRLHTPRMAGFAKKRCNWFRHWICMEMYGSVPGYVREVDKSTLIR